MNELKINDQLVNIIHPDVFPYLWFADGKLKNIDIDDRENIMAAFGIRTNFDIAVTEPSAIFTNYLVSFKKPTKKMPYYPTYRKLEPTQRGLYFKFLQHPYEPADVGCLFLFYYGLERHLYMDNESVVDLILKLREINRNPSFLRYSANALLCTSIRTKKGYYVEKLMAGDYTGLNKSYKKIYEGGMTGINNIKPYANMSLRWEKVLPE